MSVSPDLSITPAVDARRMPKAPTYSAEGGKDRAVDFAAVYANERQTRATNSNEAAAGSRHANAAERPGQRESADVNRDAGSSAAAVTTSEDDESSTVASEKDEADRDQADPDAAMLPGLPMAATDPALSGQSMSGLQDEGAASIAQGMEPSLVSSQSESLPGDDSLAQASGVAVAVEATRGDINLTAMAAATTKGAPADSAVSLQQLAAASDQQGESVSVLPLAEFSLSTVADADISTTDRDDLPGNDLPGEAAGSRFDNLIQGASLHDNVPQRSAVPIPGPPLAMQQPGWSEGAVERVMWMSSQNLKSADIQLDPAELGRMEVRIELDKDQVQVTFASPHAGVREVVEGQAQRLRDMFNQQGMQLLDVNVSDQSLARGWQGEQGSERQQGGSVLAGSVADGEELVIGSAEIASGRSETGHGLVDYYA
ncbi:flagellar hook-length control protein FliK [Azomonas macrocytogenes]|uniref:Flagellar hook-length control protein FliK n=1 Tax=Azomonas macrocytogenes TaxID=69962 RepID=A0A839T069_AZOMA|nr:flagellar hook-length control protein FliK [Azomonas macrocytogenes]MBB3101834.1 flagellar hook-length control protein FliK [Azomonas macrocytogenes]